MEKEDWINKITERKTQCKKPIGNLCYPEQIENLAEFIVEVIKEAPQTAMGITKEQAKYWFAVAKKDLSNGNIISAKNVYEWLKQNNAWYHAKLLKKAIDATD